MANSFSTTNDDGNANIKLHQPVSQPGPGVLTSLSKSVPIFKNNNNKSGSAEIIRSRCSSSAPSCSSRDNDDTIKNDIIKKSIPDPDQDNLNELTRQRIDKNKSINSSVPQIPSYKNYHHKSNQTSLKTFHEEEGVVHSEISEKVSLDGSQQGSKTKDSALYRESCEEVQRKYAVEGEVNQEGGGKRPPRMILDIIICRWRPWDPQELHHVDVRLLHPPNRCRFYSKVMAVKFLKWLMATAITLVSPSIPYFEQTAVKEFWIVCVPIFVYFTIFVILRTSQACQTRVGCSIAVLIYALCLGIAGGVLYCAFKTALVPTAMLTLSCTYGALTILTAFVNIDLTRDSVIPSLLLVVMSFSLLSFIVGSQVLNMNNSSTIQQFGLIWFPSMVVTQSITLVEMAEMKAIIDGLRIDLTPSDWIVVAAFLL